MTLDLSDQIQLKLDQLTKPQGSLGQLERIVKRVALNQQTLTPVCSDTLVCVFAADHGLAESGVSAFPQAVTGQMVMNFLSGGAAINVFSKQAGAHFKLVDCGIKEAVENQPLAPGLLAEGLLINCRIAAGTKNSLHGPAMTEQQFQTCLDNGKQLVADWITAGYQLVALGEMGIGNTSSAALLMNALTDIPLAQCVGRGTGHDDAGLANKLDILQQVVNNAPKFNPAQLPAQLPAQQSIQQSAQKIGAYFSGFEIATMAGVILAAHQSKLTLLIDGFIVASAALLAKKLSPQPLDELLFAHEGDEAGHSALLSIMNAEAILSMNLRLGEGSGAALAIPLVKSAVAMLNDMASFASAGVSNKS
jgi:nicotinate-nucleotide--dimethylbenzimidazole phosphoribosyltransferase